MNEFSFFLLAGHFLDCLNFNYKLDTILSQHLCKLKEIDHFSREYVSQKVTQDEMENLNRSITINRNL